VSATYTFDVFATLDGFGSYGPDGDWGGYWGKQGPEFLDRRLAVMSEDQRLVLGATTFREFVQLLGPSAEESGIDDPVNNRLRTMPTTVVSKTLTGPFAWSDATLENGDAVDVVARLKEESETPLRSHGSLSMNRSLMAAGLVDRVQLTIFPVISGRTGTNPIFAGAADLDLELAAMSGPHDGAARGQQSGHRRDRGADVVVGHVAEDAAEQQEVGGHGAQVGRRGTRVAAHHGDRG